MPFSILDFFKKILLTLEKPYTYMLGVVLSPLGISLSDGTIDKIVIMLTIMTIAISADFIIKFFYVLFISKTEKVKSRRIGDTINKLFAIYFVFTVLAVITLLTHEHYLLISEMFEWILFFITIVVLTRELISILETADEMGFPYAKRIKEWLDAIPNMFDFASKFLGKNNQNNSDEQK